MTHPLGGAVGPSPRAAVRAHHADEQEREHRGGGHCQRPAQDGVEHGGNLPGRAARPPGASWSHADRPAPSCRRRGR